MPPKKTAEATGNAPTGLTAVEYKLLKAIMEHMQHRPDTDWDSVAAALGLKDAKCAKERWRQMSVRHGFRAMEASNARKRGAPEEPVKEVKVAKKRMARGKRPKLDTDEGAETPEAEEEAGTDEDEI